MSRMSAQAPSQLGKADRGPRATAPPSSYSTMGSCGAVGSVRARYLVFFQYLGTDFKYVSPPSPPVPPLGLDLDRQPGRLVSGCAILRSWAVRTPLGARLQAGQLPQSLPITPSCIYLSAVGSRQ